MTRLCCEPEDRFMFLYTEHLQYKSVYIEPVIKKNLNKSEVSLEH